MKIYNMEKTQEVNEVELDLNKGYLKPDSMFITHHEAVEPQEAVYVDRVEVLPNGSTQTWKDLVTPAIKAKEAYDEYEDIQVYVPYAEEELKDRLRAKRANLLTAFDKWEKAVLRGRETDDTEIMAWYQDLLDLKESAFVSVPDRVNYYL